MKKYISGWCLILVVLSACKVSKDIPVPKPELPASFRVVSGGTAAGTDTGDIADLPWKAFFTEPELSKLIDTAIVKNFDMQIAIQNIEASQLLFRQVKWDYLPATALGVNANSSRPSDNSLDGLSLAYYGLGKHIEDYSADLSVSWEADIWRKIRNKGKAALADYLQTIEARKAVQTQIVISVSKGYINLLMLDEQLEIARKNIKLNDSTLAIVTLQYDAGQVTSLAVQQAQAQELTAAQLVPELEQNITIQENALSVLAGQLPARIERTSSLNSFPLPSNVSAGLPADLVSHRPDVRSAELALKIANAKVGITKAAMYPALRITADGGINSFLASNWFNIPSSLFGIVAGSVVQPLFDHKELSTQYKVSEVEREKTVLEFRQSVLHAVGETSDALTKIQKLQEQQTIAKNRTLTLEQATSNANQLFRNGMATYLEVITAQANVLQSELTLAVIQRDELNAQADLYRALGGGWK